MIVGEITFELDDFRPFRGADGAPLECVVYGEATIAYDGRGDWHVSAITLDVYPASEPQNIDEAHPLWRPICDEFAKHEDDTIAARIAATLAEDGIRERSDSEEHGTLCHAIQGITP